MQETPDGQRAAADFFRGSDGGDRVLYVWPDLRDAVRVCQRCVQATTGGMALIWHGIASAELEAALRLMGLPAERWPEVSADVAEMGRIAADGFNRRTASRTTKK